MDSKERVLARVEEKDGGCEIWEKSEHDWRVESDEDEGRERERPSKWAKEGSDAAGRREDEWGGEPTSSDVRDGVERLSDEPE